MLVVVALIGLLAGLSYPAASAGLDSVRIASSSDDIATFLNSAVNRAERRQVPVEVEIVPKDNRLTMQSTEKDFRRTLQLPDGITLEGVTPISDNGFGDPGPAPPFRMILMPGASAPGIGVQISNRHGARRIVRLDPMTGFPHVESVIAK
jgi:hypothetical protein